MFFVPTDYLCPNCGSRKTVLKDRKIHSQPANSRYKLLNVDDIWVAWTIFCFDCTVLCIKEDGISRARLDELRSGKVKIFFGAYGKIKILEKGSLLKVKDPGTMVVTDRHDRKHEMVIPETVAV